jgi:hypothetical protein
MRKFVQQFLVNSITYLDLPGETQFMYVSSGGQVTLESSGITLLPLQIKETHYF